MVTCQGCGKRCNYLAGEVCGNCVVQQGRKRDGRQSRRKLLEGETRTPHPEIEERAARLHARYVQRLPLFTPEDRRKDSA